MLIAKLEGTGVQGLGFRVQGLGLWGCRKKCENGREKKYNGVKLPRKEWSTAAACRGLGAGPSINPSLYLCLHVLPPYLPPFSPHFILSSLNRAFLHQLVRQSVITACPTTVKREQRDSGKLNIDLLFLVWGKTIYFDVSNRKKGIRIQTLNFYIFQYR